MIKHNITKFLENNQDLVTQLNIDPEYLEQEILQCVQSLPKLSKPIYVILREALQCAIDEECGISDAIYHIANKEFECQNTIQMYFKDVGKIYENNDNNFDIEYCPENRDKLIKMNLKTAISIAKGYQGSGVPLEDLISAANLGLCKAFDKFNPDKNNLQPLLLEALEGQEEFTGQEVCLILSKYINYGKLIDKIKKRFQAEKTYKRDVVEKWILSNIKPAKFSSVAVMWMRACILSEIDQNSRLVKKPKVDIYRDKEKYGVFLKEDTVDFDDYQSNNPIYGDDDENSIDTNDAYNLYKSKLRLLLKPLTSRERNIVLRRFGIGLPRSMSPKEIGFQENLTVARVSQIFQNAVSKMREHAQNLDIDAAELFSICKYFK